MAVTGRSVRRRYVLVLLVLTAVTFITLDQRRDDSGPLGAAGSIAHEVVAPVRSAADAVVSPVADWLDGVTSAGSLRDENRDLRRQLAEADARVERAEDLIEENRQLAELLDLEFLEGIPTIAARIVSPPTGNYEETVTIGKGESDGVRKGMPVVASEGLYGRVVEASASQSKVMLLTDERFSVSVRSARDRLVGIAAGDGSDTLLLEFIEGIDDADPVVLRGDTVVTSGRDGSLYPAGIPVGRLGEVREDAVTAQLSADVEPAVDLGAVEVVKVVDWDSVRDVEPAAPDDGSRTTGSP